MALMRGLTLTFLGLICCVSESAGVPSRAPFSRPWSTGCTCYRESDAASSTGVLFHPPPNSCRALSNLCANHWKRDGAASDALPTQSEKISNSQHSSHAPYSKAISNQLTALQALERLELLRDTPLKLQIGRQFIPVHFKGASEASDVAYGGPLRPREIFEHVPVPTYVSDTTWTVVDSISLSNPAITGSEQDTFAALILQASIRESSTKTLDFVVGFRPLDLRHPTPICQGDIVCASRMGYQVLESIRRLAGECHRDPSGMCAGGGAAAQPPVPVRVLVASGYFQINNPAVMAQTNLGTVVGTVLSEAFGAENVIIENSNITHTITEVPRNASLLCMKWCEHKSVWAHKGIPRPKGIEYLFKEIPNTQTRVIWVTTVAILVIVASWHGSFTQSSRPSTALARSAPATTILSNNTPSGVSTALPSQSATEDFCSPLPGELAGDITLLMAPEGRANQALRSRGTAAFVVNTSAIKGVSEYP